MVFLYVLAGIIVVLSVTLVVRGRRHTPPQGPESQASLDRNVKLETERGIGATTMINNSGGAGC